MARGIENALDITLGEYLPKLQKRITEETFYFGVQTLKNPLDFWVYQEIISDIKPDVIVEIGTNWGGSTLAFAHLLDACGHGKIIGVDRDQKKIPLCVREHSRVVLHEGDAIESYEWVSSQIEKGSNVLAVEDSSHTYENTLEVLRHYSQLVIPGGYFIVEDSICHHGLALGPRPGPYEAIEQFLEETRDFHSMREKESFLITWNPKGFLHRSN